MVVLRKLLEIEAVSGEEDHVVDFLFPILEQLTDRVWIDAYGNLLAEKHCGYSNATVLLSAHMDTAGPLKANRRIKRDEDGIWYSDQGKLGADDRAGIFVILKLLETVDQTGFKGLVKVALTRDGKNGFLGSAEMDSVWLLDVDLCLVLDQKGKNDIVIANSDCAFCADVVGDFIQQAAAKVGLSWQQVKGGCSDTVNFVMHGVNAVNLSVGYYHEDTDDEYLKEEEMLDTVRVLQATFNMLDQMEFPLVPDCNKVYPGM